jgi:hypothetical protein
VLEQSLLNRRRGNEMLVCLLAVVTRFCLGGLTDTWPTKKPKARNAVHLSQVSGIFCSPDEVRRLNNRSRIVPGRRAGCRADDKCPEMATHVNGIAARAGPV